MAKNRKNLLFEILAVVLIIIFAVSISPKTLQNDTFYTVTIGELITKNGIDMQDHFSWHEGLNYTYPHWLYDVFMYFIYNIGGWIGVYISTCVLASILGICIYEVNSKLTKNKVISFVVTIGTLYLLKDFIAARAQLATFILFILLIYNIEKFIEEKKIKNAIIIFVIHTLIANLHVAVWPFSFILYLPYIAEYLLCQLAEIILYKKIQIFKLKNKIKKQDENVKSYQQKMDELLIKVEKIRQKRQEELKNPYKIILNKNNNVKWLILIMIMSLLTGMLTPLGTTPYTYTFLTMQGNTMQNISEHLPMVLINNTPIMCAIIIFLGILIFTKAKINLSDLFMVGGLAYLMFLTGRQSSLFALIGSLLLTRIITGLMQMYLDYPIENIVEKFLNKFSAFVIISLVLLLSLNFVAKTYKAPYVDERRYPVEASEWILNNLDINNIKLYNEYNYGSYLLYKGIPVFIDSRADLYAPEFNTKTGNKDDGIDIFSDFINSSSLSTYYEETFKKYEITHVIVYKESKINMLIEKVEKDKYNLLYSDDYFVVYEYNN